MRSLPLRGRDKCHDTWSHDSKARHGQRLALGTGFLHPVIAAYGCLVAGRILAPDMLCDRPRHDSWFGMIGRRKPRWPTLRITCTALGGAVRLRQIFSSPYDFWCLPLHSLACWAAWLRS